MKSKNQQHEKNLLERMKKQLLDLGQARSAGRIVKGSPFYRLPAASKWEVGARQYNLILLAAGIALRTPTMPITRKQPHEVLNDYMVYVIKRLRRLISEGKYQKAWKVADLQIRYSVAFRSSAINHVLSGWYYHTAFSEIWKIARKVEKLVRSDSHEVDFKRVYIPKANGKWRPLGVPKLEWRIFLHLKNGFYQEILQSSGLLDSQHAYVPTKGVMTAWREKIAHYAQKPYQYGSDLKDYFPSVSMWHIADILETFKAGTERVRWIKDLCSQVPKLPKEEKLDESRYKLRPGYNKGYNSEAFRESGVSDVKAWVKFVLDSRRDQSEHLGFDRHHFDYEVKDLIELQNTKSKLKERNFGITPGGTPQGMPLSPFLAILGAKEYLSQHSNINYADDQEFYGDKEFSIADMPELGITHSTEKCMWLVRNGEWQVDEAKFLGFTINESGEFKSNTRNGTIGTVIDSMKSLYTDEGLRLIESLDNLKDLREKIQTFLKSSEVAVGDYSVKAEKSRNVNLSPVKNWEVLRNIAKRNIFGFVMSCLNIDDWTNDHAQRDRDKGFRNMAAKVHKKALVPRVPNNLDSSYSIPELTAVVANIMRKGRKTQVDKIHRKYVM